MRQAGVNAVKVYSVAPPDINKYGGRNSNHRLLKPGETGKIGCLLQAAWNCGDRPIFVVLSFDFGAADVIDPKPNPITHLEALKQVFFEVAKANAAAPALAGGISGGKTKSGQAICWNTSVTLNGGVTSTSWSTA